MPVLTRCRFEGQLLILLAALLPASSSFAQDSGSSPAEEKPAAKAVERDWDFRWDNRPSLRYGDLLRIDVRARLVSDMRRPDAAFIDNDTSRFDIARRRIGVEGEIGDVADFQIEREFADRRPWRDVYVNYRGMDRLQLQAGTVQAALRSRREHEFHEPRLRLPLQGREALPGPRPGTDGSRPGWRSAIRGGRIHSGRRQRPRRRPAAAVWRLDHRGPAARAAASFVHLRVRRLSGRCRLHLERRSERHRGPSRAQRAAGSVLPAGVCGAGHAEAGRPRDAMAPRALLGAIRAGSDVQRAPRAERRGSRICPRSRPPPGTSTGPGSSPARRRPEARTNRNGRCSTAGSARWSLQRASRVCVFPAPAPDHRQPVRELRQSFRIATRAITLGVNWSPNRWIRVQGNLIRDTISIPTGEAPISGPLVDGPSSSFWSRVVRFRFAL